LTGTNLFSLLKKERDNSCQERESNETRRINGGELLQKALAGEDSFRIKVLLTGLHRLLRKRMTPAQPEFGQKPSNLNP
jgi:hypothetical protein